MNKTIRGLCAALILLSAPIALAGDGHHGKKSHRHRKMRRVASTTGLVSLRHGKAVRVSLVEVDKRRPPRKAALSVIDDKWKVVRKVKGAVSPRKALFLDLERGEVPKSDPLAIPVRFEVEVKCKGKEFGPIMSVELYDKSTGVIEYTERCGNPCCGAPDFACGPPLDGQVVPDCPTRELPI